MAGGASFDVPSSSRRDYRYPKSVTAYVVCACICASCGGLLFGYDLGISGGVTSMDDFLIKFFPTIYRKKNSTATNNYCKFDSQVLTLFTSSLYLAGFLTTLLLASFVTQACGRRISMCVGGACFMVGSALDGLAQNLGMLILGRLILGIGIGFTNQVVPLYLSEMAPPKIRGGIANFYQLAMTIGATIAFLVNYATQNLTPWGWRLSLGMAFLPATIITIGSFVLPDSPSSLLERGHLDEGHTILQKMRGTMQVEEEFHDLLEAIQSCKQVQENQWHSIFLRKFRPQLVMAFAIPFFQQVTGINIITFYAPILFEILGFGSSASLYSAIIIGGVSIISSSICSLLVDRVGRRKMFISGGFCMFIFQVLIGLLLQLKLGSHTTLSTSYSIVGVLLVCLFCISFSWSWGPLGWLVPSEIFPLEIRSACQSINICVILFFTFVIAQIFLAMLCHLKASIFFFFAGWVFFMTMYIYYLFPETKCVPLEGVANLWKQHPFWRIFYE